MWKNDLCGIYKIVNTINNKVYIGQSKHIKERWSEHKKGLRKNRHKNEYLQRAWNKYGESSFIHEIIEICDEFQLDEREIYYINFYDSMNSDKGYNLHSGGLRHLDCSESTRAKLRISGTGENNPNSKKVVRLEDNQIYDSINLAAQDNGTHAAMIYRCCTLQRFTAGNYHWMYLLDYKNASDEEISNLLSHKDLGKTKTIIYLNTNEIFSSISKASKQLNINANSISQCCLHNRETAGKTEDGIPRIFMYYEEFLNSKIS